MARINALVLLVNSLNSFRIAAHLCIFTGLIFQYLYLLPVSALRFRGHFNGLGDVCIYLDTILTVTLTARKGNEEFVRTFNDDHISVLNYQCENDPVQGVAYIQLGIPDFVHANKTGGGLFRYMFSALDADNVVLDRSMIIKPSAIFPEMNNPTDLVMFKDPKTLHIGDQDSSYLCKLDKSAEFRPGATQDGYKYSVSVRRSYFHTQAFNIHHSELGPSVRCHALSEPNDKWLIISCIGGGVVVVAIVAAVISVARHRKNYSSIL